MSRVVMAERVLCVVFVLPAVSCLFYIVSVGLLSATGLFSSRPADAVDRILSTYHASGLVFVTLLAALMMACSMYRSLHKITVNELRLGGRCPKCCYPRRDLLVACTECGHEFDSNDKADAESQEDESREVMSPGKRQRPDRWIRGMVRRWCRMESTRDFARIIADAVAIWLLVVLPACLIAVHGVIITVLFVLALIASSHLSEAWSAAGGGVVAYQTSWWALSSVCVAIPVSVGVMLWLQRIVVEELEARGAAVDG